MQNMSKHIITVVIAIVVGLIVWGGKTVQELDKLSAQEMLRVQTVVSSINELKDEIRSLRTDVMTHSYSRVEIDSKFSNIENRIDQLVIAVSRIEQKFWGERSGYINKNLAAGQVSDTRLHESQ